jgi:uncharacterized cofD-like protein
MLRAQIEQRIASCDRRPAQPLPARRALPRVVALGGGTGLPVVLRGLKDLLFPPARRWVEARDRDRITGIVAVADDGGSSGRLRRAYGVLPPGDARNCLLALAHGDPTMSAIFGYRFEGEGGLGGHNLGNLILTALSRQEADFARAVDRAGRVLAVRGRVLPSTLDGVSLLAEFADGSRVAGESRIAVARRPIRRVTLRPSAARGLPEAREAIGRADLITLGPGSLYTSLIPVLLVRDLCASIARSGARVVLIMNLMSEPGETDGYSAADVLRAVRRHAPGLPIHDVLLNSAPIPASLKRRYAAGAASPIVAGPGSIQALGCRVQRRDLLWPGPKIRHDGDKLARVLLDLASGKSS